MIRVCLLLPGPTSSPELEIYNEITQWNPQTAHFVPHLPIVILSIHFWVAERPLSLLLPTKN
jgi:hypothetical protein